MRAIGLRRTEAKPHSAPYIVSIKQKLPNNEEIHIFSGSIIDKNWILTAAHGLSSKYDVKNMIIYAGRHNIKENEITSQQRHIKYFIKHELYIGGPSPYDIALIYVEKPFIWNFAVQPISLPKKNTIPKGSCIVYGWGNMSSTEIPYYPHTLQQVQVPIIPLLKCEKALGGPLNSPLHFTNICTGPLTGKVQVCSCDSGGPLIQENFQGEIELIGIISWGVYPCGLPNSPSVYVRVSAFIDWIKKKQNQFYLTYKDQE